MKYFIVITALLALSNLSGMYPIESQFFKTASEKIEHIILTIENNNAILSQIVYQTESIISIFDYEDMIRSQLAESIIDNIVDQPYRCNNTQHNNNTINTISLQLWPLLEKIIASQEALETEFDVLKSSYDALIEDCSDQLCDKDYATQFLNLLETTEARLNNITCKQQELIINYQYLLEKIALNKKNAYLELKKIERIINND